MIDEFQDVSPQIVSWIRASLAEIRSRGPAMHVGRGAQRSSLLCVGDDWQSIYGWRGSSPSYFMEFNKEFRRRHHQGDAQRQLPQSPTHHRRR
jgi:superfamily I DNA/RNA helicase